MGASCSNTKRYKYVNNSELNPEILNESNYFQRVPMSSPKRNQIIDANNLEHFSKSKANQKIPFDNLNRFTYVEAAAATIDPNAEKLADDRRMITRALNRHFIFTSLTEEDKDMVTLSMKLYKFNQGDTVFEQNESSRSYYIVRFGILDVYINNKKVNKIFQGEGFGELALLHSSPRTATVKCAERVDLWGIQRSTFRKVIEDMNTFTYEQNREFLEKVTLLHSLISNQKDALAASLSTEKFNPGQKIIVEGELGEHLYIIKEGVVSVVKNGKEVARLKTGKYFGEMALMNNMPRSATCIAIGGIVKCVVLSRETLERILGNQLHEIIESNTIMEAINKSECLSILNIDQKERIIKDLNHRNYKAGDIIIPNGTACKVKLYIVISGRLQYARSMLIVAERGICIGDEYVTKSIPDDSHYDDDIIASSDMKIGELTKYQFEVSIGGKFEEVVKENAATNVLRKVYLFNSLDRQELKELFSIFNIRKFNDREVIIHESIQSSNIFIVKRGSVDIYRGNKHVRRITKHDYFGERGLLFEKAPSATCVARGRVSLWYISFSEFVNVLNEEMRIQLLRRISMEDEECELTGLKIRRILGKGMFSNVFQVRTENSNELYALKCVHRETINKFAIQEQLISEKEILQLIDHPLIVKLVKTFKDEKRIYLLQEYIHGLELSVVIRYANQLTNSETQFYIGSLILALEYIHERNIVYRDLNPDNVMVETSGFIKLVDFGTAKILQGRTYTLVGAPHYVAPEIIIGRGYSKQVDLWSLGVCMYEMLCGKLPFGANQQDPYKIYEEILDHALIFEREPEFPIDSARALIKQLLSKFAEERCQGLVESLKKHEWFVGFDWESVIHNTIVPPFTPDIGDMTEELEEEEEEFESWDSLLEMHEGRFFERKDHDIEVIDSDMEEYRNSIPVNWDEEF